jgi:hypothetical protein
VAGAAAADTQSSAVPAEQPVVTQEAVPVVELSADTSALVLTETAGVPLVDPQVVNIATTDAEVIETTEAETAAEVNSELAAEGGEYLVSAAASAEDYEAPGHSYGSTSDNIKTPTGGLMSRASHGNEDQPLSYALVLALVALIGLVPVSRRNIF